MKKKKKPYVSSKKKQPAGKSFSSPEYKVVEETELLSFLIASMKGVGRNSVKSTLKRGQVLVDGKSTTQHNHPLQPGQVVTIQSNQHAIKETLLHGIEVLYEDDGILVISKEAGILSVATKDGLESSAHSQLMAYVRQDHPKNRVYIVHRLDRDTSGVMMFAKTAEMKEKLQENWKETVLERVYTALVEGEVVKKEGTISSWLVESKAFKVHSAPFDNGGKQAVTHFKLIRTNKQFSLLEVQLETGRKNQIRVHMEEIGHPIVGDKKYGATGNPIKRLGLHATTLVFIHPTTGETMRFHVKMPKSFTKLMKGSEQNK